MHENSIIKNKIRVSLLLFTLFLILWKIPSAYQFVHQADVATYNFFSGLISSGTYWWIKLSHILNHKIESWLNVVIMLTINFLAILHYEKHKKRGAFIQIIYYWLFFQFVLLAVHFIFQDTLQIHRESPSIQLYSQESSISNFILTDDIKEFSTSSFPAGHTLIAIYWMLFSLSITKVKYLRFLIITTAIVLCSNRLLTGAHWLSDVIFTINLGAFFYYLGLYTFNNLFSFPNIRVGIT